MSISSMCSLSLANLSEESSSSSSTVTSVQHGAPGSASTASSKTAFAEADGAAMDDAFSFRFTGRHDHGPMAAVTEGSAGGGGGEGDGDGGEGGGGGGGFYSAQTRAIAQMRDASDALFTARIAAAKAKGAPPPKKART